MASGLHVWFVGVNFIHVHNERDSIMETLTVYPSVEGQCWMIRSDDPSVVELFGTDTLPSSFTLDMGLPEVLNRLMQLNPDKVVKFQTGT